VIKKTDISIVLLFSLFIISLALFSYQISLTRLYSAILSYHYVFLTTSFAILGLGMGSVAAYVDRGRLDKLAGKDNMTGAAMGLINKLSLYLSCALVLSFILIYVQPFVNNLIIYIALGITPFLISGYLYALLFRLWASASGKLYFADLLGAGAGSVLIVILLNNMGMFRTLVLICLLPLLVALILPLVCKRLRLIEYALIAFLAFILLLPGQTVNTIESNFYALLNNTGKTFGEMQRTGLEPEIVFSRWDSFARTDLIKMNNVPEVKILTIDGAANAPMYVWDGRNESLDLFKMNTGYVPFAVSEGGSALIIGAGGGRGVLYALAGGSRDITAVEINPASIKAVQMFGDFNGHIFNRPEVTLDISDGRNFVRTTEENFDIIFLSLVVTNTTQGAGFALSENYIHTVEAVEDYLDILNPGGKIAFVAHDQHSIARLTTTAMQALMNRSISLKETPDHIAIFYQHVDMGQGSFQMLAPVIIVKNEAFTESESRLLEQEIINIGATPSHIPHVHEEGLMPMIKEGQISFAGFIGSFELRADPVTDNSPYFFNFERGVPAVVLQILILCLIFALILFGPFASKKNNLRPTLYFGLLGMGFMMVQIPLIQKFILYLGHPAPAFSYTLAAMLIGCGIGGYLSKYKLFNKVLGGIYLPPLLAAVIIVLVLLSLNAVFQMTAGLGIAYRILIASLIAAGTGFFMGMPFPRGLSLVAENNRTDIIPLMWGINGVMSVAGSVISIILSMTFGFFAALIGGALIYVIIALFKHL